MKSNEKGFAHFALIVLFVLVCVSICGAFIYIKNTHIKSGAGSSKSTGQACNAKGGVKICIASSRSRLASSETTELKTTIANTTKSDITKVFNCTFTDPSILLNNTDL